VARRCTPGYGLGQISQAAGEIAPRTSFSGYAQSRGDMINIQRVGVFVLSSQRSTTALVMAWVVISAHDGERLRTRYRLPSQP